MSTFVSCDEVLRANNIACLALQHNGWLEGDDRKTFEFGHKFWKQDIVNFWDNDFSYYICKKDDKKAISILTEELGDCLKLEMLPKNIDLQL